MKFFQQLRSKISSWTGKASDFKSRKFPGWKLAGQIGCGAFGRVYLLKKSGRDMCVKWIDGDDHPGKTNFFLIEFHIHRQLKHANIIEMLDIEVKGSFIFMFVEYAARGTVQSRLKSSDPAQMMTLPDARRYFQQLVDGVECCHGRGFAHRDLKPDNLLIDGSGNLKIADFGFAVQYRRGNQETLLAESCGTAGYMAPEMFRGRYRGEGVDVWACGIILVNLLTGLEPWSRARSTCPLYASWVADRDTDRQPWNLMDAEAVNLVKEMLHPDPRQRATIADIKASRFYRSISACH